MLFNSFEFLIFFPIVSLIYFAIPKKYVWFWLLVSSYYFYMSWNATYAILIFLSTITTYLSGLLIDKVSKKKYKIGFVIASFMSNLLILGYFKYYNFAIESINGLAKYVTLDFNIPYTEVLLPVGISFYTFQALSYTMDVYRGDILAERHFGHYALFVSFFPQLVAGPIEKSKNLLPQLRTGKNFEFERFREGLMIIGWGLIKKVVIADRIAVIVDSIYNDVYSYHGIFLIIATLFFSIQIYCDFSAYSDIAIGCAKILGYDLMVNFRRPYFSKSIKEFWSRWHISLSTWFKEYLYIPLGGNRHSKVRNLVNLMIVFLVSGLWHGASWTFVIWGALHGLYQIVEKTFKAYGTKFELIRDNKSRKAIIDILSILVTFISVNFAWIFFRANSMNEALYVVSNLSFNGLTGLFESGYLMLGLDTQDLFLVLLSCIVLFFVDAFEEFVDLKVWVLRRKLYVRWPIYIVIVFSVIILGYYGGYDEASFIYFQF